MKDSAFVFRNSAYDGNCLLPQVSKALEKRTELRSRAQYASLWKLADQWNNASRGKTKSRLRTNVMSIVCLALGVFLFLPGLMKPQELLVPLFAGAIAIGAGIGGLCRSRKQRKSPFDQSAELLLRGKDVCSEPSVLVSFDGDDNTQQK